jgi:PhnB protein
MATTLNPYLNFDRTTRQAMEFYRDVFGGELSVMTFGDMGTEGADADGVMHSSLVTDKGLALMASDAPPGQTLTPGDNFGVSLSGDDEEELLGYWAKLSEGGTITVPMEKQMWGDSFGMCTDRFGTPWLVNIAGPAAEAER